jgi:hypothetical protein
MRHRWLLLWWNHRHRAPSAEDAAMTASRCNCREDQAHTHVSDASDLFFTRRGVTPQARFGCTSGQTTARTECDGIRLAAGSPPSLLDSIECSDAGRADCSVVHEAEHLTVSSARQQPDRSTVELQASGQERCLQSAPAAWLTWQSSALDCRRRPLSLSLCLPPLVECLSVAAVTPCVN